MSVLIRCFQTKVVVILCLGLVAAGSWILYADSVSAQQRKGEHAIEKIRPVPEYDASEKDFSESARRRFNVVGPLDYKFEDRIVVGDVTFPIAQDYSVSSVRQGAYVGVKLNDAGEVVAIKRLQSPSRRR